MIQEKVSSFYKALKSDTAKDTFIVVFSKFAIAFFGFIFTIIASRSFSVRSYGVFASIENQIQLLISIADIGMSAGIINYLSKTNIHKATKNRIIKTFFVVKILIFSTLLVFQVLANSAQITNTWLITIGLLYLFWQFTTSVLNGQKLFKNTAKVEISLAFTRLLLLFFLVKSLPNNENTIFISYSIGLVIAGVLGAKYIGTNFLKQKIIFTDIKRLLLFSGPIGIYKIISSITDRIDIQAVSSFQGMEAAGIYSIGFKLAIFIQTISLAYTLTLSSRFVAFTQSKQYTKSLLYLKKALYSLTPIILAIFIVVILSPSVITFVFGEKYQSSIGVFKILTMSRIFTLIEAPLIAAIIFAFKKPKLLIYSAVTRLAIVYLGNYVYISNPILTTPAYISLVGYGVSTTIILFYSLTGYKKHIS